jgi:hypothetical protein
VRKDLESKIAVLSKIEDSLEYDQKNDEIARRIASFVSLYDLTSDGDVVTHDPQQLRLSLQIDPTFDADLRKLLIEAAKLYLTVALDDEVIKSAWSSSTDKPLPVPEMYEMSGGMKKKDSYGNQILTLDYQDYFMLRRRPTTAETFTRSLKNALCRPDGDPALLAISRYTGGKWWGSTYKNFFSLPPQQLSSLSGPSGYFYIALNTDRMKPGQPHWNSPAFWASKIGHECLHCLGYDHPIYADVAERDKYNAGNQKAFIVAYELAILNRLKEKNK